MIGFLFAVYGGFAFCAERIPGTQLTIEPPVGLERAVQFPGYMEEEYGTSIMVTEIPGPLTEVLKGLTETSLAARGFDVLSLSSAQLGEHEAILIHASQIAYEIEFLKWFLVFGNTSNSFLVVGTYQKELHEQLSSVIKDSLLSVRWDVSLKTDRFDGLTFRIREGNNLKIAETLGNALILNTDGKIPITDDTLPFVIIASSYADTHSIADKSAHALQRLYRLDNYSALEAIEENDSSIDGIEARTLRATAIDAKTGREKFVYFAAIYTSGAYYIFQAESELAERDRYESEFAGILESFKLVQ
jgi:hypothetical protein